MKGGRKPCYSKQNPQRRVLENRTQQGPEIQASTETRTRTPKLVADAYWESRRANPYTRTSSLTSPLHLLLPLVPTGAGATVLPHPCPSWTKDTETRIPHALESKELNSSSPFLFISSFLLVPFAVSLLSSPPPPPPTPAFLPYKPSYSHFPLTIFRSVFSSQSRNANTCTVARQSHM